MRHRGVKSLADAPLGRGMRVVARVDFNVPCSGGTVRDDFRLRRVLPTLKLLSTRGCRTVLISHLDPESGTTLVPVARYLAKQFSVSFAPTLARAERAATAIPDGGFLLIENIRHASGEVENTKVLARQLAGFGTLFVNDAFSVSHRPHASVVGVPRLLPSYAGLLLLEEVKQLSSALTPPKGSLFILGGAKFETKLPLLVKFLKRYARVFVGGALANNLLKANGHSVGKSLVSHTRVITSTLLKNTKLTFPQDVVVQGAKGMRTVGVDAVARDERIVDAGPKTGNVLAKLVHDSTFILWNGPLGEYQKDFAGGTEALARAIVASGARSVIGGGDTVAAVSKLGTLDRFSFVSTAGGAMLEFLDKETLVGLEALKGSL